MTDFYHTETKERDSQVALVVKSLLVNSGDIRDVGSIPGLGWFPGEGNGNLLQYSCLEIFIDRGACLQFMGATKRQTLTECLSKCTRQRKSFVKFMRLAYYFKMFLSFPGDKIILEFGSLMKEIDAQTQSGTYFTLMVRKSFQATDSWSFSLWSFL